MNKSVNTLPSYEKMKDSGVEWLGEIPEGWEVKKLKYLGAIYAGLTGKKGDDFSKLQKEGFLPFVPFTSISNSPIVSHKHQFVSVKSTEEQALVKINDILFLMSSETLEDIAKCSLYFGHEEPLYLNSFCKGFRLKSNASYPLFINHLLQSDYYREYFATVARGFTRINLKQEFINNASVLLPPLPEQKAIADFLDEKTRLIDQAVTVKEQQIALLKERKQILIQNAVTQGLNPNAPMRNSGVEWIGEIPKHWDVKKLKFITSIFRGKFTHRPRNDERLYDGKYPFFQTGDVAKAGKYLFNFKQTLNEKGLAVSTLIPKGTIVITIAANIGDVSILNINACFPDSIVGFKPKKTHVRDYLYYSLSSMKKEFIGSTIKNTQMNLNVDRIGMNFMPCPPIKEQIAIVTHIEKESAKIDQAIDLNQQQIDKLKEYKATLINSAVTGKIKIPISQGEADGYAK